MAKIGRISEFQPDNERISAYLERVELYFQANEVKAEKQVPVLLSVIGGKTYELLRDLLAPTKPSSKSLDELTQVLTTHYEPKPLVIAERYQFHRRNQATGESITEYVAAIRKAATHCAFGDYLSEALRDRLVCGIRNESTQKKLLTEADLTFTKAIEIAKGMEAADHNTQEFKGAEASVGVVMQQQSTVKACYRCGGNHQEQECWHQKAVCHRCKKRGHIARVCRGKQQRREQVKGSIQGTTKWVETTERQSEHESSDDTPIFKVGVRSRQPLTAVLELNGVQVPMEVDTGAAVSLMSSATKQKLFPEAELMVPKLQLKTYTAETIETEGVMELQVRYGSYEGKLDLYVVKGCGPTLLGRDWMQEVRLDWRSLGVAYVSTDNQSLDTLLETYGEVFKEEIGLMSSRPAKLEVKPEGRPKFCRARPVPFALREAIERKLDHLKEEDILEEVPSSEWASPIVAVPKSDGSVRLCGDYKSTLNPALEVDKYPLPRPDELMTCLTGGQKFTKLDLTSAYQQMPLDEGSRKLVTINTHRGLFRFKRLPFGVASAPALFQKTMDAILQGLPQVMLSR